MKKVWTNSPYITYSSFAFSLHSVKHKIKDDFQKIKDVLKLANNDLDNEKLKNIFFKNNTAYWWENYLKVIDALKNHHLSNSFYDLASLMRCYKNIFYKFIFKELTTEIEGWTRYSITEFKGWKFFRWKYINELLNESSSHSSFNNEEENIYQFGLNLKVLYDIWNTKIFFKYNREIKILILSLILIERNCFTLLPKILFHMESKTKPFINVIDFLKEIVQ